MRGVGGGNQQWVIPGHPSWARQEGGRDNPQGCGNKTERRSQPAGWDRQQMPTGTGTSQSPDGQAGSLATRLGQGTEAG